MEKVQWISIDKKQNGLKYSKNDKSSTLPRINWLFQAQQLIWTTGCCVITEHHRLLYDHGVSRVTVWSRSITDCCMITEHHGLLWSRSITGCCVITEHRGLLCDHEASGLLYDHGASRVAVWSRRITGCCVITEHHELLRDHGVPTAASRVAAWSRSNNCCITGCSWSLSSTCSIKKTNPWQRVTYMSNLNEMQICIENYKCKYNAIQYIICW